MSLRQLFIASLLEPKKMAAFRIISIGKVIQYVFIFIILITIFSFFQFAFGIQNQSSSYAGLIEYIDGMEWILYPFAFIIQSVMSTLFVFSRISIMAIVGFYLLKLMKRRGDYRHVWRTTAFAYSLPTVISFIMLLIGVGETLIFVVTHSLSFIYLYVALNYYPSK
ncbi:MAG: DUF1189 family protein [Paenisporosarcina sp.]